MSQEMQQYEDRGSLIDLGRSMKCLKCLFTKIRDKETGKYDFNRHSKRLMHMICEEGLSHLSCCPKTVTTPTGATYEGCEIDLSQLVAVSIIRAADSMLESFNAIAPEASVGKILIQRDEETALPKLYYSKLPPLDGKNIVLLDPMLATGGSAIEAIRVLIKAGAPESSITFFNVVCCPDGIKNLLTTFPNLKIVTGAVDPILNEKKYIVPGLGDYGDRFFGTV